MPNKADEDWAKENGYEITSFCGCGCGYVKFKKLKKKDLRKSRKKKK